MSRYFAWVEKTGDPVTIYWRRYAKEMPHFYKVYLGDQYINLVMDTGYSGWKAVVSPGPSSRGVSMGGFKDRYKATQYMLWAHGITAEDNKP